MSKCRICGYVFKIREQEITSNQKQKKEEPTICAECEETQEYDEKEFKKALSKDRLNP